MATGEIFMKKVNSWLVSMLLTKGMTNSFRLFPIDAEAGLLELQYGLTLYE